MEAGIKIPSCIIGINSAFLKGSLHPTPIADAAIRTSRPTPETNWITTIQRLSRQTVMILPITPLWATRRPFRTLSTAPPGVATTLAFFTTGSAIFHPIQTPIPVAARITLTPTGGIIWQAHTWRSTRPTPVRPTCTSSRAASPGT